MTDERSPKTIAQRMSDAIWELTGWRTRIVLKSKGDYHHRAEFMPAFHPDAEFTWVCKPYDIEVTGFYLDTAGFPVEAFIAQTVAHFTHEAELHKPKEQP